MKKIHYTVNQRICTKCKILKPFSEFNWDKRFNITFSRCKPCFNEICRNYRQSKQGKAIYDKWVHGEGKKVRDSARNRWVAKNKEKCRADYYVSNAIRDGRLIRLPCEKCGNAESEAHHDSYKRQDWLKVRWLCKKHHVEITFHKI
jgi:hypothetical protein